MSLYWVYDLPSWLFAVLTIAIAVTVRLAGLCATRKWVRRVHGSQHSHNDVVGYYLAAVCVFYGISLYNRRMLPEPTPSAQPTP